MSRKNDIFFEIIIETLAIFIIILKRECVSKLQPLSFEFISDFQGVWHITSF